jgi:hypothetical protein
MMLPLESIAWVVDRQLRRSRERFVRQMTKPTLRKVNGQWMCFDNDSTHVRETAEAAYAQWKSAKAWEQIVDDARVIGDALQMQ